MGQRAVKQQIEAGLKLYNGDTQHQEHAVKKWKAALEKIQDSKIKFTLLGYLAWAHFEWGRYRQMLAYAIQQIDVANELGDEDLKAEAYMNLARSNEKLCEYHKSISYARHSLSASTATAKDDALRANVHVCLATANLGFSHFQLALENLEKALPGASRLQDKTLECTIYGNLGDLYCTLKDYEKALRYHVKASELVRCRGQRWSPKTRTLVQLNLATPYRKLRKLDLAMDYCEEAMKMALQYNDRLVQARCLCVFADIHRNRGDNERAYPRYESALNITVEQGDRFGQLLVLSGMTKTLVMMKQLLKAINLNMKTLEMATAIGNKIFMLRCHWLGHQLHRVLGDIKTAQEHATRFDQYLRDLSLYCGVCHEVIGDRPNELQALACHHIYHAKPGLRSEDDKTLLTVPRTKRCVETGTFKARGCPDCRDAIPMSPPTPV